MIPADSRAVTAPRPPEVPPPHRLPIVATLAPLVVSLVLFAVTRSPFTLVFAVLGPVVAIASIADAALQRRRTRRRETARFAADVARVTEEIAAAHHEESATAPPNLVELLARPALVLRRWNAGDGQLLRLGTGALPSSLRYQSSVVVSQKPEPSVDEALTQLRRIAAVRDDAPIAVEPPSRLTITGPDRLRVSAARSVILQLAATHSPRDWTIAAPVGSESWLRALPHAVVENGRTGTVRFECGSQPDIVVDTGGAAQLSIDQGDGIALAADGTARGNGTLFRPDLLSAEEAAVAAHILAGVAGGAGIRPLVAQALPAAIRFAELGGDHTSPASLSATVGVGPDGPTVLDLVADGPHAIVGGTTGSGKSELLLSWVLGMATDRAPDAVSFLFVDFKGGASFGSLLDLPHSVGVLTDLDAEQADRALASLSAEVRSRERRLAALGVRGIDEARTAPFGRLVIVVDEFAALVQLFPDLNAVFADIAARGRSLGLHLLLCTQRPAGSIRDAILANCALRISLRVTSAAESVAVLGTDAASTLPARPLGRAYVSSGGAPPSRFQVALSDQVDVDTVIARWEKSSRPRVPWLPPLPRLVPLGELGADPPADGIRFALADLPAEQDQRPVTYLPREHGSLLVVGGAGSGKTAVLSTFSAAPSRYDIARVPASLPSLWDFLVEAVAATPAPAAQRDRVVLLDDLDSTIASCDEAYQAPLVELLSRLLRDGPALGLWCVLTAQRISGALHGLSTLCGSQLVLRMPNRAEHALAGGVASEFVAELPPGRGMWRGHRVQVAAGPPPGPVLTTPACVRVDVATARLAVVSTRPERITETIRERAPGRRVVALELAGFGAQDDAPGISAGSAPPILIADPELWQSQWGLLGRLQRNCDILFDGCSLADLRVLTRSRELPPPFPRGERPVWLRTPDGRLDRAVLVGS